MLNDNNKLLAEFLEIKVLKNINSYTGEKYYYYNNSELEDFDALPDYSSDWNELMKIVEKIKKLEFCDSFTIEIDDFCMICCKQKHFEKFCSSKNNTFQAVYDCCIDFVNWHNLKTKNV